MTSVTVFPGLVPLTDAAQRVLAAIAAAGGRPYLVGGAVRDALLSGARPKDVDIEVFGLGGDALVAALRTVAYVDQVGQAFSVLKVTTDGQSFDVSVPRRDVKTGAGHRGFDVVPAPDATLAQAAARRDFTINALMYDPVREEVVDSFGGLADLRAGILRHPTLAFADDPLRVLRGARFAAQLGFTMAPQTAALCRSIVGAFAELSRERVWGEWRRIAAETPRPSAALGVLAATGWEAHFPELAALHGVEQDPVWHPEGDVFTHSALAADKAAELADTAGLTGDDRAVVVLAALLHDVGKVTHTQKVVRDDGTTTITSHGHDRAGVVPVRSFLRRIDAPRHIRDRVVPLVAEHMVATAVRSGPTPAAVRRLARRLAPATMTEWALVTEADKGGRGSASRSGETGPWLELAARLGTMSAPTPRLLRGEHLIAAGMRPGAAFGPILAASLEAQDAGLFDDEGGAVAWLSQHLT